MSETEPARAVPPLADDATLSSLPQSRYAIERTRGGGGRAVYEVLDKTRHVSRRVICRTNLADATMIVAALRRAESGGRLYGRPMIEHEVLA